METVVQMRQSSVSFVAMVVQVRVTQNLGLEEARELGLVLQGVVQCGARQRRIVCCGSMGVGRAVLGSGRCGDSTWGWLGLKESGGAQGSSL